MYIIFAMNGMNKINNSPPSISDFRSFTAPNRAIVNNGTVMNIDESYVDKVIRNAELSQGFEFDATQLDVIRGSLNKPVVLITGKAGTGKTSITRALLDIYTYNNMQIRCCALSAKAAQRITEATGYKASTIHRLLKYQQAPFLHRKARFCQ